MPISSCRRTRERGSALLVVLVLAAIVAIMLYRELPIAAFEAQRQKEALTISRGNEYKRGIKLFVRKVGRFPASIEELESTNRMRFLRHRYVDPLTGKDDWRIVHAGPGGTIIDSKVANKNADGKSNALGQGAVFAGFNNTFTGDATLTDAEPANVGLRQRPAATKNAGSADGNGLAMPQGTTDPSLQDPNGVSATPADVAQVQAQAQQAPVGPGQAQPGVVQAGAMQPDGTQPGQNETGAAAPQVFNGQPSFDPNTGQAYPPNQAGGPPQGQGNGIGSVAQQLNTVNPRTPEQAQQNGINNSATMGGPPNVMQAANGQAGNNLMAAGGIAGVASIAKGKSIKSVNEQTKYSLWEFYYDLRKEQSKGAGTGQGMGQGQGLGGQPGLQQMGQQSTFGQAPGQPSQSGFGVTNSGSAFNSGSNQDTQQAPPQQNSAPPQQ